MNEYVKPSRDEAIEAVSAALHVTTDRVPGLNPGPVLTADGASVEVAADAVLALLPGRPEAEVKAEAWDEGAAAASPYGGAFLRSILIYNPYRDA